jgi:hypothetical protein
MTYKPTAEGLRRYPYTGGFFPDLSNAETAPDPELPCTCRPGCAPRCAGECGCKACDMAFAEFADIAGFYVEGVLDEPAALTRYRGG